MAKANLYNLEGKKTGTVDLDDAVFAAPTHDKLVHQVYTSQAANRRTGSAHTKIRSAVRGGGRKPWKQKGTGNARTGSIRNPIWRGGGTIFGPLKERNFTKKITASVRRQALAAVLSQKLRNDQVVVVDQLAFDGKTKNAAQFFTAMDIPSAVVAFGGAEAGEYRAVRNIPKVRSMEAPKINVYDLLNTKFVVTSQAGIEELQKTLTKKS